MGDFSQKSCDIRYGGWSWRLLSRRLVAYVMEAGAGCRSAYLDVGDIVVACSRARCSTATVHKWR